MKFELSWMEYTFGLPSSVSEVRRLTSGNEPTAFEVSVEVTAA